MDSNFEVAFLGTNGSCAYNNGSRERYGSNTLCVAVKAGEDVVIFDAGSGICSFSGLEGYSSANLRIFFSHYHIDHCCGLLFFPTLFDPGAYVGIYGGGSEPRDVKSAVEKLLSPPLQPVGIEAFRAEIDFFAVKPGSQTALPGGGLVRAIELSHPGGSLGYRLEYAGKVFCYCTDVELRNHQDDDNLLEFTREADLLVMDSAFGDGEVKPGWGHSSWRECAQWAKRAGAKKLALFHYGYEMSDCDISRMEARAKEIFPDAFAPADRMKVKLLYRNSV